MSANRFAEVRPRLLRRLCGGWLAVSEDGSALLIGVEGATEEEARQRFAEALVRWGLLWSKEPVSARPSGLPRKRRPRPTTREVTRRLEEIYDRRATPPQDSER